MCRQVQIRVIFTAAAMRFVPPDDLAAIRSLCDGVFTDADEWAEQPSPEKQVQEQRQRVQPTHSSPWRRGDAVLHIELRKWADVFLIAPLSANTLAKLAGGQCDNLLTCVARAWDFAQRRPFVVAPAMNTLMWTHALTADQLARIEAWGVTIVPPVAKTLACGDIGMVLMCNVS